MFVSYNCRCIHLIIPSVLIKVPIISYIADVKPFFLRGLLILSLSLGKPFLILINNKITVIVVLLLLSRMDVLQATVTARKEMSGLLLTGRRQGAGGSRRGSKHLNNDNRHPAYLVILHMRIGWFVGIDMHCCSILLIYLINT